jgi:hypothetical protein
LTSSLSTFVMLPVPVGTFYVILLALLRAACEKYDELIAIPSKIDAIPRTKIDANFVNASTHTLNT